jgi:hypothetical protein
VPVNTCCSRKASWRIEERKKEELIEKEVRKYIGEESKARMWEKYIWNKKKG